MKCSACSPLLVLVISCRFVFPGFVVSGAGVCLLLQGLFTLESSFNLALILMEVERQLCEGGAVECVCKGRAVG